MNTPTFDINKPDTPCYVTEECYLRRNCEILKSVQDMTGCKIQHLPSDKRLSQRHYRKRTLRGTARI